MCNWSAYCFFKKLETEKALHVPPKRPMQQRLEQMLRLIQGIPAHAELSLSMCKHIDLTELRTRWQPAAGEGGGGFWLNWSAERCETDDSRDSILDVPTSW